MTKRGGDIGRSPGESRTFSFRHSKSRRRWGTSRSFDCA